MQLGNNNIIDDIDIVTDSPYAVISKLTAGAGAHEKPVKNKNNNKKHYNICEVENVVDADAEPENVIVSAKNKSWNNK